jgi:1,4-alpha-glucan branching enzyme
MQPAGELAIVLHTHMPYVEGGGEWPPPDQLASQRMPDGFGTWPFGEEWLWEAVATSYVPLLDVLGRAPVTLSLTPVLCDQLDAPGAVDRCLRFLNDVRSDTHIRDRREFRESGQTALVTEIERSAADYAAAAERLEGLSGGLLEALGRHVNWTSSATHAVLPLLATDSGIGLQLQTGIESHRRRFGAWGGGFWLPECAHAPWLDSLLEDVGVRATCVELTGVLGLGDARHLRPIASDDGPVLWSIDRQTMALVWSDHGYPASAAYRDYHRLTSYHHRVWSNDGRAYDPERAAAEVANHARDFVTRVLERVRNGGVCVCALDTELLGHWWYEGVQWLEAVFDEAARQGLRLTTLDEALTRHEPVAAPSQLPVTSWGDGGDLRTWSGPPVAEIAWQARTAELRTAASRERVSERALRELLALQSSDWAFLVTRELAGNYPVERAAAHASALDRALSGSDEFEPALRNLAPELVGWEGVAMPAGRKECSE